MREREPDAYERLLMEMTYAELGEEFDRVSSIAYEKQVEVDHLMEQLRTIMWFSGQAKLLEDSEGGGA